MNLLVSMGLGSIERSKPVHGALNFAASVARSKSSLSRCIRNTSSVATVRITGGCERGIRGGDMGDMPGMAGTGDMDAARGIAPSP